MEQNELVNQNEDRIISLSGMYKEYFLDYASYVILERAVPGIDDGLKPVQRRILHSMREMDDGRFHKVANIIGQTMKYHPHGDAAIGDALVGLGQKDLLIDCQGNWGDTRTGDRAAAARYIEARLTKFALDVAFNPKTTEWQLSYDGRNKEPMGLPMKFPLVLSQGVEGIAVGLSTKILPHNFIELIKASIDILNGKKVTIYPDFPNGGSVDVENYNGGRRGGKVRVRASIEQLDKKTLIIRELPFGITTTSLIDSILKANDKGKIKIKKVVDNTAKDVEILIELARDVSPQVTIDALYAFSYCEMSISPNACIIIKDKPHFISVEEILDACTNRTRELLKWELQIKKAELEEKWHFASLEKIFIEQKIYRDIEECETWEEVLIAIDEGLKPHVKNFKRAVTQDDIIRLTEIKIKRISKFNTFKADELIQGIEADLTQVEYDLANIVAFTIAFYQRLLQKYSKGQERKTKITTFDTIQAAAVVANNAKLYANLKEGFIGHSLKRGENVETICECSDIDDVIVFKKDGSYLVTRIADKQFVGKNIIHLAIWKKGDSRTTYNAAYSDGKTGRSFIKRFQVTAITRDKPYNITQGTPRSRLLHFSAQPNGEAELIKVQLTQGSKAKIKIFEYNFADLAIKGRTSKGNLLSKYPVQKATFLSLGKSTLGAMKFWMDEVTGRLNDSDRGHYLGAYDTGDSLLVISKKGNYQLTEPDLMKRFDVNDVVHIFKYNPDDIISLVYYDGERKETFVKRFQVDTKTLDTPYTFITEHRSSELLFVSTNAKPSVTYSVRIKGKTTQGEIDILEQTEVRGRSTLGSKFSAYKLKNVKLIPQEEEKPVETEKEAPKSIKEEDNNPKLF
ncbi:MAG: DNA gyrase/topoisomerase IV subunit A [Saprospiraceae bacterium]